MYRKVLSLAQKVSDGSEFKQGDEEVWRGKRKVAWAMLAFDSQFWSVNDLKQNVMLVGVNLQTSSLLTIGAWWE